MTVLFDDKKQCATNRFNAMAQRQRALVKQELQQKIQAALQAAKNLSPDACLEEIENGLLAIQAYCTSFNKTFIVVEEKITCDRYGLGGYNHHTASLLRGSSQEIAVAICVTTQGSLLYHDGYTWIVYCNVGDVDPIEHSTTILHSLCSF